MPMLIQMLDANLILQLVTTMVLYNLDRTNASDANLAHKEDSSIELPINVFSQSPAHVSNKETQPPILASIAHLVN
jgi:hypothetical protein